MIKHNIKTKQMSMYDLYLDYTIEGTYLVSIIHDEMKVKEFSTYEKAITFFNAIEYHGLKSESHLVWLNLEIKRVL